MRYYRLLVAVAMLALASVSWAHKAGDSYLSIAQDGPVLSVTWDVALRDLDLLLTLDSNDDSALTWGEVRQRGGDIEALLRRQLSLSVGDYACEWLGQSAPLGIVQHSDGLYAAQHWLLTCPGAREGDVLGIDYRLLDGIDSLHRGLLSLSSQGQQSTAVLRPDQGLVRVSHDASLWQTFVRFMHEGVHHLLTGYDHIVFLLCLLLPACLAHSQGHWQPSRSFRSALLHTAGVVTAFTLAHSLTLALAALQVVILPSRWVESAIAASIVLAALHTLSPRLIHSRAWLAGGFGLIHGFGFAGVLQGLPLTTGPRLSALAGFNVGVELGQLSIVLVLFPLLWWARSARLYRVFILPASSWLIALVASLWLLQRVFEWQLIPG